ncbi:hypothetical protein ABEB36_005791 [Hypothenemus hampei]|uniref:Uncharacterized protein n=1 Tax=Hypothenemus hampei TaxID=57062 RepID=A0ABD1EZG9_HYPHA
MSGIGGTLCFVQDCLSTSKTNESSQKLFTTSSTDYFSPVKRVRFFPLDQKRRQEDDFVACKKIEIVSDIPLPSVRPIAETLPIDQLPKTRNIFEPPSIDMETPSALVSLSLTSPTSSQT